MIEALQSYHPLIIEGKGGYDERDPQHVSAQILDGLAQYWRKHPPQKPLLLVTQGDPYEEKGISAITRLVSDKLDIPRALVFLDPHIADYHAPNADRHKVIFEIAFSSMAGLLDEQNPAIVAQISEQIDAALMEKNAQRLHQEKAALPAYYFDFALLQEVTKIACRQTCGGITVAHTSHEISPFSVTSFFEVGLKLGLISRSDMVPFVD